MVFFLTNKLIINTYFTVMRNISLYIPTYISIVILKKVKSKLTIEIK